MTGEFVYVGDDSRCALRRGRPAYSLADLDAEAGRLTLEWTEQQFAVLQEIEASPIQIRQRVKDKCSEVRGVGDQIPLAGKQACELRR